MEVQILSSAQMSYRWSPKLAYVVGLITADGSLSNDGRHIDITSKDQDLIEKVEEFLKTKNKIGTKSSSSAEQKKYYRLQFSNVRLYKFLSSIGLHSNKSKSLSKINLPTEYFVDFLRGYFDGDGYTYSYWDKRWRSSFMFYSGFTSSSPQFLKWLQSKIKNMFNISGKIKSSGKSAFQLVYAKKSSVLLMKKIYYYDTIVCLERKKIKVQSALKIINKQAQVAKLADAQS